MTMTRQNHIHSHSACPCESNQTFGSCCEPYLVGNTLPPTAEALMRSRYTAYVVGAAEYLQHTWHTSTRPDDFDLTNTPVRWLGLTIRHISAGGRKDNKGMVEFVARYKLNGKAQRLHEISQFIRENGQWYYLDGEQINSASK